MSVDTLRKRLASNLGVSSTCGPDEWIPIPDSRGPKNTNLSKSKIEAYTINALNRHRDGFGPGFRDSNGKFLDDLRGLTGKEINYISNVFLEVQTKRNDLEVSLACSGSVAVAAHEAKIIADHGLLGKVAVGFIRLID